MNLEPENRKVIPSRGQTWTMDNTKSCRSDCPLSRSDPGRGYAFSVVSTLILLFCLFATPVLGDSVIASQNWNTAGLNNWTATTDQTWLTLDNPMAGGNTGGYYQIKLDATDPLNEGLGEEWWSLTGTDAANLFTGSWTNTGGGDKWLEFDFWASNVVPTWVQVVWYATNSRMWRNTVFDKDTDSLSLSNWTTFTSATLANYANWDYGDGTQQEFIDDLGAIDWIGVYIWRNTAAEQMYGIDNFMLWIPEPCELIMLAAAGIAAAGSLRKKRKKRVVDQIVECRAPPG